ncbi:hypothetical protein [Aeromonas veronii]|uniref:hypothetical protein n=1 Tax=Aeromonas veronii TaxID=654 RepID=UPI000B5A02CF|nr:hypothetical protein [Aeromonas veronii]
MTTMTTMKTTNAKEMKFLTKIKIQRRMQQILIAEGNPVSLSVADKIEATLNGYAGITYTGQEKGRRERAYVIARHQIEAEESFAKAESAASKEVQA